jgi:hypothetical protein
MLKMCTKCKEEKDITNHFFFNKRTKKLNNVCKNCRRLYMQIWTKSNKEKRLAYGRKSSMKSYNEKFKSLTKDERKSKWLRKKYKINLDEYQIMVKNQNNCCAICDKNGNDNLRACLEVDHNHKTGKVRALLCSRCNTQLGVYENNKDMLELYLNRYAKKL